MKNSWPKSFNQNVLIFGTLLLASVYCIAAVISINWGNIKEADSLVWPAAGIGYAGLLLGGVRLWPAIFIGSFAAALITGSRQPYWVEAWIAGGNTLATVIPVLALLRYPIDLAFLRLLSMLRYQTFCGILGSLISAAFGAVILQTSSEMSLGVYWQTLLNWTLAHFIGAILVGPLITSWWLGDFRRPPSVFFLIVLLTALASWMFAFHVPLLQVRTWHVLPLLIWASLAYQVRGASATLMILSTFLVISASMGALPHGQSEFDTLDYFATLQQYLAIVSVTILCLASIDEERHVSGTERLQLALDAANQGTFECDLQSGYTRFNGRGRQLANLPALIDTARNRRLLALVHPDDRTAVLRQIRETLTNRSKQGFDAEFRLSGDSQTPQWVAVRGAVYFDGLPPFLRPVAVLGTIRDISDWKIAEETRERLSSIIEHAPDFIGVSSNSGQILFINPGGRDMLGFERDYSLSSMRMSGLYPPGVAIFLETKAMPEALRHGVWEGETEFLRRDGSIIPIVQTVIVHRDKKGKVEYFSTIARDITARKQDAARQNILLGELSHRVKNMMTVIQSIVRRTSASTNNPEDFSKTFQGRIRSLASSHALLTDADWDSVSLKDIFEIQLDSLAVIGEKRSYTLHGPTVLLGAEQATNFGLAIHELTVNAVKYGALSKSDGSLKITWTVSGNDVNIIWKETSKSLNLEQPAHRGFGMRMIDAIFPGTHRQFLTEGLVICIPMKIQN